MTKAQQLRIAAITIVCAAAFRDSFGHIVRVAMVAGNTTSEALTYPVAIDGVILVSALTLAAKVGVSRTTRMWAMFGRYFGFTATLLANGAAAGSTDLGRVAICLLPGISLIATVELLIHAAHGTPASRAKATETAQHAKRSAAAKKAAATRAARKAGNVTPIRKGA
jgi:hypothetical protein